MPSFEVKKTLLYHLLNQIKVEGSIIYISITFLLIIKYYRIFFLIIVSLLGTPVNVKISFKTGSKIFSPKKL